MRYRVFARLSSVVTLAIACTGGTPPATVQAAPAAASSTARTIVRHAIDAMGGEAAWSARSSPDALGRRAPAMTCRTVIAEVR